jgi:hypothetical protein
MAAPLLNIYSFLVSRSALLAIGVQPHGMAVASDTAEHAQSELAAYLATTYPTETCRIEAGPSVRMQNVINNAG